MELLPQQALWIVAGVGLATLTGYCSIQVLKKGFGPFNLRVIAIVLVAIFATILALANESSLTAAMGILGAIAGYVFGIHDKPHAQ